MKSKSKPKRLPKLSDAERHKRFVEMAHEVEASEKPNDFESAFKRVVRPPEKATRNEGRNQSRRNRDEGNSR
jgi:hypothetical protein